MANRTVAVAVFLAVLAGCGGEDQLVVAALGDSITAGAPLWDPNPVLRDGIPDPDRRSQYGYWAERSLPGTDFRNCGVPGERTDQLAHRLQECARGADVLVVQGGTNDIVQSRSPAATARDLRSIVRSAKRLGLRVTIAEVLPLEPAPDAVRALNRRIARIGAAEDVPVQPWHRLLADPQRPGRMHNRFTDDLVHPSVEGYRRLGESLELP